jgi:acetate kinase
MEVLAASGDPILVVNSGSSSLKFGLYRRGAADEEPILTGSADGIGRGDGSLEIRASDGTTLVRRDGIHESQSNALAALAAAMREHASGVPAAVGHRVVHGGPHLCHHQVITPLVMEQLRGAVHFAPLHIPQALSLIAVAQSIFPAATQFACFDTAFHQTIPEVAAHLPLPQRYFDAGVRRYGFHGISYESLVHHVGAELPRRAIFAHLGNGASLCAVLDGKSIDTTMGLTPTGGILMGTRSGDLDPGVMLFLLRNEKLDADGLEDLVNRESGLFGFSGSEGDVKALQERGDSGALLALEAFAVAVRKQIGAYMALLGGVDLLVFTGGIGEHSAQIRTVATEGLEALGLTADRIQIIATEEERQIARHCREMMRG